MSYAVDNIGSKAKSGSIHGGVDGGYNDEAHRFIAGIVADMMDKQQGLPPLV